MVLSCLIGIAVWAGLHLATRVSDQTVPCCRYSSSGVYFAPNAENVEVCQNVDHGTFWSNLNQLEPTWTMWFMWVMWSFWICTLTHWALECVAFRMPRSTRCKGFRGVHQEFAVSSWPAKAETAKTSWFLLVHFGTLRPSETKVVPNARSFWSPW